MQCQSPSDAGVVALSGGFRRSLSNTFGGGADRPYEDKEETLPKNIRGKDKFEWKVRHLCFAKALDGSDSSLKVLHRQRKFWSAGTCSSTVLAFGLVLATHLG